MNPLHEIAAKVHVKTGKAIRYYPENDSVFPKMLVTMEGSNGDPPVGQPILYDYTGTDELTMGEATFQRYDLIEFFKKSTVDKHENSWTDGKNLWFCSADAVWLPPETTELQWTIARIEYCLKQVAENPGLLGESDE